MTATTPIVRKLVEKRKALGLLQADVAGMMESDANLLSRWERGARQPGAPNLDKWARALGVDFALVDRPAP